MQNRRIGDPVLAAVLAADSGTAIKTAERQVGH
jgi:hypothetical protein